MDYAFKQFTRSFLLSAVIFFLPASYLGMDEFARWLLRNLIFLMIWILICFSAGYFAHWSGKNKFLYKRFEKWFQSASIEIREESLNKLPLKFRLPLMWSRCSRCMSYSLGGILSFTAALFYFYRPAWAAGLYFLFLGASTASAFAMFLYFREEWILYKKENQH